MKNIFKFSILLVILTAFITSCKEDDKSIAITGVSLSQTGEVFVIVGKTLDLTATVTPSNATQNLVWSSSNSAIAKVIGGTVTGILPGTATITVSSFSSDKSASITVTVTNPAFGIEFLQKGVKIAMGEKRTLIYSLIPHSALNRAVTWKTSNSDFVSIDPITGEITGESLGQATITVTLLENDEIKDECIVEVTPVAVSEVRLSTNSLLLIARKKETLSYTIYPTNADNQAVKWSSNNSNVATVDEDCGEITAIAAGTATITITTIDGEHTDDCIVTVPENLLWNPSFEEPNSNSVGLEGWEKVSQDWFDAYYGAGYTGFNQANINRVGGLADAAFLSTGNGAFFIRDGGLDGQYACRMTASNTVGLYQIITVIQGSEYEFSLNVGFRRNTPAAMSIRDNETVKILSKDGTELIYEKTIPAVFADANTNNSSTEQTYLGVTGRFTVPEDVTEVRFQFDIQNFASPNQTPLTVIDNFVFRKVAD